MIPRPLLALGILALLGLPDEETPALQLPVYSAPHAWCQAQVAGVGS